MRNKKILLLVLLAFVSLLLITTNYYTIRVLSAVRSYIHGESEYSKGQKDASLFLVTYAKTGDTSYYNLFKSSMQVPLGDNIARTALLNDGPKEIVEKGFLMGKNHPADFDEMIWLFKRFGNVSFMKNAIQIWGDAEPLINQLNEMGAEVHEKIRDDKFTPDIEKTFIVNITDLTAKLSQKETAFSLALGEAARDIKQYLLLANILLIVILLGITAWYSIYSINRASAFEKELKIKIGELYNTNQELENFNYIASHDLQEPLKRVEGFLQLLQKKYEKGLDEKAHTYLDFALDGTARMKMLIKDLLMYSTSSMAKIEFEKTDLNELLNEVKENFQEDFSQPGAVLFIAPMPQVIANKTMMRQLFQNLVTNAIKYKTETPPQVFINATENKMHWQFTVKDNGIGIDPRHHRNIFEVFQRLHTQGEYEGTGIGLAICKKIVGRHGGEIWVKSKPGEGSTFIFTLSKNRDDIKAHKNY